jgi:phosphatidylglycerophosphate synthase
MIDTTYNPVKRRPLASRNLDIARWLAEWLIARNVSANAVSFSSIVCAAAASICLIGTHDTGAAGIRLLFALAAIFIQLRLLANLLDGMIAVGSGKASRLGELYNEVPDRIADAFILIGAGFAAGGTPALGYQAALLAGFVAYLRALGSSLGVGRLFMGPMAKPQRMATMTAACVYVACAPSGWPGAWGSAAFGAIGLALALVIAGCLVTSGRRLRRIAQELRAAA